MLSNESTGPELQRHHAAKYAIGRLVPKENDWLLAGSGANMLTKTRTRGAGKGRPNLDLVLRKKMLISCCDSSSSSDSGKGDDAGEGCLEEESDGNEEEKEIPTVKPTDTRVILEVEHVKKAFGQLR
jgi:hypothetical protein